MLCCRGRGFLDCLQAYIGSNVKTSHLGKIRNFKRILHFCRMRQKYSQLQILSSNVMMFLHRSYIRLIYVLQYNFQAIFL
jgi:hypothetical protein